MANIKARKAKPYDGKPTWHGLYLDGGIWRLARNQAGLPIAYASEQAALQGAKHVMTEEALTNED